MDEFAVVLAGRLDQVAQLAAPAACGGVGLRWDVPVQIEAVPAYLADHITAVLGGAVERVVVSGTLDARLVWVKCADGRWVIADLSGSPLADRTWPGWARGTVRFDDPGTWLSRADVSPDVVDRITSPRVLLAALYHPEYFPLPRLALGLGDVARAARSTLLGQVEMMDMQLGAALADILAAVEHDRPDILGLSATFGQHDLLTAALDAVYALPDPPLVIVGGSLPARNELLLLQQYPDLLVARASGESTIADTLAYWHGDLAREQIRGIGYRGAPLGAGTLAISSKAVKHTGAVANRRQDDILPELDLLDPTFAAGGVAQIEASRGCTSSCSFCPRSHKGQWSGGAAGDMPWILTQYGRIIDRHPDTARTLYVVDEEFIGRGPDAVERALAMAQVFHRAGFAWETSCRVDQIAHPGRNRAWHTDRARMWRALDLRGLRRCLFGVESGVDSVLERFHKEVTGEQNALAIRTLSALGIGTRFTYIIFDHLMSVGELAATEAFLGRTDLLLRPLPHLSVEEIVDGVRDEAFVAEHITGRPFYSAVSYPLVSMECLTGAPYTRRVQAAGLAGAARPSMGRVDAAFADARIGAASDMAQRWVDRNFPLDYTLKSVEKVLDRNHPAYGQVRAARVVLKDAGHELLGAMVALVRGTAPGGGAGAGDLMGRRLRELADARWAVLAARMEPAVAAALPQTPDRWRTVLETELKRWHADRTWNLINGAAEPCAV